MGENAIRNNDLQMLPIRLFLFNFILLHDANLNQTIVLSSVLLCLPVVVEQKIRKIIMQNLYILIDIKFKINGTNVYIFTSSMHFWFVRKNINDARSYIEKLI